MGDFNFPNIDWCNHTTNTSDNSLSAQFYFATQDAYMIQHVLKPTRYRKGQASSVLDLVFTLDPNMVTDLEHLPPLGYSDHEVLLWSYVCYNDPQMPAHNNQTYDYFRGDYVTLNDYFSTIDWDLLFDGNSISLNWNVFKEKICEGCQKFIPMSSVSHQKSSPPWWTKALSRAIVKKRSLYFKYWATKSTTDYYNYASQGNFQPK